MAPDAPPAQEAASAVLMAASKHIATTCAAANAAFINCKKRDRDPGACLAAGDGVTACVAALLKSAHATAPAELGSYVECLDYNRYEDRGEGRRGWWRRVLCAGPTPCSPASSSPLVSNKFEKCRKEQEKFEAAFPAKADKK